MKAELISPELMFVPTFVDCAAEIASGAVGGAGRPGLRRDLLSAAGLRTEEEDTDSTAAPHCQHY